MPSFIILRYVYVIYIFLDIPKVSYNCTKFHYSKIFVTDFL